MSNADQYTNSNSQFVPLVQRKLKAMHRLEEAFVFDREDRFYPLKRGREVLSLVVVISLAIPAFMGCIINGILYYPLAFFIRKKTKGTVFYHSALFGIMIIAYPIYCLIACVGVMLIWGARPAICLAIVLPLSLLVYSSWKVEWIRLTNYLSCSKSRRQQLQELLSTE